MSQNQIPSVFNFSGGKTSAYMVLKYYKPGDLVIFCDTGREHPKTYKFINDFEAHENIKVIRLKYMDAEDPFRAMINKKNNKILPYRMRRFCTDELKIKITKKYLKSIGILKFKNYIGFRFDEPQRVKNRHQKFKKVIDVFPLYNDKITKQMINSYFEKKPYNLEIPHILGNCTLCFMKGKNAIMAILREYPELAEEWIKDEQIVSGSNSRANKTYMHNTTIKQLRDLAQNNLFKDYNLNEIKPEMSCACTI